MGNLLNHLSEDKEQLTFLNNNKVRAENYFSKIDDSSIEVTYVRNKGPVKCIETYCILTNEIPDIESELLNNPVELFNHIKTLYNE
jgi:hypothetical protein